MTMAAHIMTIYNWGLAYTCGYSLHYHHSKKAVVMMEKKLRILHLNPRHPGEENVSWETMRMGSQNPP
ncbi:mCG65316, partial [Mus musculus]